MSGANYARATAKANKINSPVITGIVELEGGNSQLPLSWRLSLLYMLYYPQPLTPETLGFLSGSVFDRYRPGTVAITQQATRSEVNDAFQASTCGWIEGAKKKPSFFLTRD